MIQGLTLGAVISAAAVDAINPCAFAVLIILLTAILAAGSRNRVLGAGVTFSIAIYISYLLMGLGLYTAIQAAGISHIFYMLVIVLAIVVGLFHIKDYFVYGAGGFVMEVPKSWRPTMKKLLRGVTSIPGVAIVGFVVSLFLLPCTSGPYIVILGLLAKETTRMTALTYLLLYNFIFIIPMLIITSAVYFGLSTEKAEEWRQLRIRTLHLVAGLLMVALGIGMAIAIYLGLV